MTDLLKLYLLTLVLVVVSDQLTKQWAVEALSEESIKAIPDFLNFALAFNKGAAFSMFAGLESPWREIILWGFSFFASGLVIYLFIEDAKDDPVSRFALVLILGGAIGNLIDRVRLGYVVDFIDVYWGDAHFPTFNIADSAISIGAAVLILKSVISWKGSKTV